MTAPREGPNPLRPYYIPPSVGQAPNVPHHGAAASKIVSKNGPRPPANSFGSSARNILSDMDYSEYLSESPSSPPDVFKRLIEQALWKYTSVLLAQPFEVAKIVLQAQIGMRGTQKNVTREAAVEETKRRIDIYENLSDSDDSPSYFTSSAPLSHTPSRSSRPRRRRRQSTSPDGILRVHTPEPPPAKPRSPHALDLKSSSAILSCLSSLWTAEGAWGVWKGTNSTYVHSILLSTLASFIRSFFSAFLALPDPGLSFASSPVTTSASAAGGLDILSSPSPLTSLFVSVSAAGLAGIILAPLDIARTKLILTPSMHPPRSIIATIETLPSWTLPFAIAPITILHSTLPTLMSVSTPLVLRNRLGIDPLLTPNLYNVGTFMAQVAELAIKLPIETVLRRAQMAVARGTRNRRDLATIVDTGPYKGIFGTMHSIMYEEGESGGSATDLTKGAKGASGMIVGKGKKRKGQGAEGLWRGWRVGMWGLVGVWGAAALGGVGGKSGEF